MPGDCCKKVFKPRKNLNRLTFKIRTPDGELYNVGTNDTADSPQSMNTFMFKITVLQKNFIKLY